jgi:Cu-Zn family superoxide dismutase
MRISFANDEASALAWMSLQWPGMKSIYVFTMGLLVAWISGLLLSGCSHTSDRDQTTVPDNTITEVEGPVATDPEPRRAETKLETTSATELKARASFEETEDGVTIVLNVDNAKPGKQAVHVHELGDCSDIEGKSMGEHFAPDHQKHALPDQEARHLGDLGNIEIGPDGKGTLEILAPRASLKPNDSHSFLGKALVVHASQDKGTQPSGDSGAPVACGVIKDTAAPVAP